MKRWMVAAATAVVAVILAAMFIVPAESQTSNGVGGMGTCITDTSGYCTFTHNLGSVPAEIQVTARSPIAGSNILSTVVVDSPTATTFRVRGLNQSGAALNTVSISFWWHANPSTSQSTTTTTTVATTTSTSTTTTTVAPTTTTLPACAPITITTGGTYSGCYQSTSTGTPAVTLATSAPVTLSRAHVIAKGFGVQDTVTGTNLTVQDTVFDQTDPGAVVAHRAIELESPASFTAVHNQFNDGDGIWIGSGTPNPFNVRDNLAFNIGRYPHPTSGNCCVHFLQTDHVTVSAGVVAYNKVQNTSGQSGVEDNLNFYFSGGSDSTHKLDVHHNLIDGAYGPTNFTGGGIMGADGGSGSFGHVNVHDNTVVSTTNYGVACAGGTDCHTFANVLVNDTLGSDGATHYYSDFGQAHSMHDTTSSDASGDFYNWRRDATSTQYPCWMTSFCAGGTGGTQVTTTEQQARDNWTNAVPPAELPIGPRPNTPAPVPNVSPQLVPAHGAWWGDYVSANPADVSARETLSGRKFDIVNYYHDWNDTFPTAGETNLASGGRFLKENFNGRDFSNSANNVNWCQIANGSQDANIRRIADNIKAFGSKLFVSFHIEPQGADGVSCTGVAGTANGSGTLAQFASAWRHIHDVFQSEGATNAVWVLTNANPSAAEATAAYPGSYYVSWIAWDPYNWYTCSGHNDAWTSLSNKMGGFYGWAQLNHPDKPLMLGEYGSHQPSTSTPSKGDWFRAIPADVAANRPAVKAYVYFDRVSNGDCNWKVDSSADSLAGWQAMGADPYFNQPHA